MISPYPNERRKSMNEIFIVLLSDATWKSNPRTWLRAEPLHGLPVSVHVQCCSRRAFQFKNELIKIAMHLARFAICYFHCCILHGVKQKQRLKLEN